MSRSYKHTPIHKMAPEHGKIGKHFANRRVRRYKGDLSSGKSYRKLYDPWEIHDWITYETLNDALVPRRFSLFGMSVFPARTIQEKIKQWKKEMLWK